MEKLSKLAKLTVISLFAFACLFISACKKDKPTTVLITVTDIKGNRVQSAYVRLFGLSSGDTTASSASKEIRFDTDGSTNTNGQIEFDLSDATKPGQAGFVNLNIKVTKVDQGGEGLIRVEEHQKNEKTIIIQVGGAK